MVEHHVANVVVVSSILITRSIRTRPIRTHALRTFLPVGIAAPRGHSFFGAGVPGSCGAGFFVSPPT